MVVMPRRRKTASSRVSGLLRTQRRCRRAFSLPPVRIWARRTAQTRSSGIFLENPAVFFYFWNATAGAETAGLSPAAAPGPVSCCPGHASTSWVCAQAVKNAKGGVWYAKFCLLPAQAHFCGLWRCSSAAAGRRRAQHPTSGLFQGGRTAEGAPSFFVRPEVLFGATEKARMVLARMRGSGVSIRPWPCYCYHRRRRQHASDPSQVGCYADRRY